MKKLLHYFCPRNQCSAYGDIQSSSIRKRRVDQQIGCVSHDETGGCIQASLYRQVEPILAVMS